MCVSVRVLAAIKKEVPSGHSERMVKVQNRLLKQADKSFKKELGAKSGS
jgi:hypothetical protein